MARAAGPAVDVDDLRNVASAVTVISGDRIRRFGYRTIGVRNLIGRTMPDVQTVPRVPGEGRELYVKVGYAY